jgi:hypothetical protein
MRAARGKIAGIQVPEDRDGNLLELAIKPGRVARIPVKAASAARDRNNRPLTSARHPFSLSANEDNLIESGKRGGIA